MGFWGEPTWFKALLTSCSSSIPAAPDAIPFSSVIGTEFRLLVGDDDVGLLGSLPISNCALLLCETNGVQGSG